MRIRDGKIRVRDPGWKKFRPRIRDGKNSDSGSGINIADPQHCISDDFFYIRTVPYRRLGTLWTWSWTATSSATATAGANSSSSNSRWTTGRMSRCWGQSWRTWRRRTRRRTSRSRAESWGAWAAASSSVRRFSLLNRKQFYLAPVTYNSFAFF